MTLEPKKFLNRTAWILLLAFVTTSAALYFFYPTSTDNWLTAYWGIIGSNASVLGIIYTIISLNQLAKESEIIKSTTKETKQRIGAFAGVSDLAKAVKLIQEIQGYARSAKHEAAIIRLQELKIIVSHLRIADFIIAKSVDLTEAIYSINRLIGIMEKEITVVNSRLKAKDTIVVSKGLKITVVNKSLEQISDLLVDIQADIVQRN